MLHFRQTNVALEYGKLFQSQTLYVVLLLICFDLLFCGGVFVGFVWLVGMLWFLPFWTTRSCSGITPSKPATQNINGKFIQLKTHT